MKAISKLFYLDLRSLAVARFLLGLLCFFDFVNRIPQINTFYSDHGVLPRWVLIQNFELPWSMSLLMMNGSGIFALVLAIVGIVASLTYAFGIRTKFSNFIVWIMILSFQARLFEVGHGGDTLLRILLFWSLFLPMNAVYSVDKVLSNFDSNNSHSYSGFASAGWILQAVFLYGFTFLYKWDPSWFRNCDSLYYAMNLDMFTTSLGKALLDYPRLMEFSCLMAFIIEGAGGVMLLIPWRIDLFRLMAVILLFTLHIGIWITMVLGNFPPTCLILWIAIIPSTLWTFISSKCNDRDQGLILYYDPDCGFCRKFCFLLKEFLFLPNLQILSGADNSFVLSEINHKKSWILSIHNHQYIRFNVFAHLLKASCFFPFAYLGKILTQFKSLDHLYNLLSRRRKIWGVLINKIGYEEVKTSESFIKKSVAGFFILLVFAWNIEGLTDSKYFYIGPPLNTIVFGLQLNQQWNMFAPSPMRDDGWFVTSAELSNGAKWDILNNKPIDFRKAKNVQDTYPSSQWRKYLLNLRNKHNDTYKLWFGRFLCRRWNNTHIQAETLQTYTLYFVRETTPPPGEPLPEPVREIVWNHNCF